MTTRSSESLGLMEGPIIRGIDVSETVSQRLEQGDGELITAVRSGDTDAYGALFERHRASALRLAGQLLPGAESEDLVSEAFTRVLVQLQDGRGPNLAFRAYLLTAIRRLHVDRIRSVKRVRTTDDDSELDRHVEFFDVAAANFERGTASDAFASLPERWQLVLWHLDVEGQKPADVAPLLGMSANSVSALAYRAREGLRQAYLQHHLADTATGNCRWTTERLGAHVRKGLSNRDAGRVDEHLDECRRCLGIYLELTEVNSNLAGILAPAVLGTAAAGYLAGGAAGVAAGAGAAFGFKALVSAGANAVFEPVKSVVAGAGVQGTAAAVVVAGLVTAGVVAMTAQPGRHDSANIKYPVVTAPATPGLTPESPAEPTAKPGNEPPAGPATQPATRPAPVIAVPTVAPTVQVPTEAAPSPAVTVPTDLGIGIITMSNDPAPLQRRITVPVTSRTAGPAKDLVLTLTLDFDHPVRFRGIVSPAWDCRALVRNTGITSMTCTRTQSGPAVPALVFKAQGIRPAATVTVGATDNADPNAANDSVRFRSTPWLLIV